MIGFEFGCFGGESMDSPGCRTHCLVAVCSLTGADASRNLWHLATREAVLRSRSWSRRSTGAVTRRAFSSLIADVLAVMAPRRVVSSTRRASRFPGPVVWKAKGGLVFGGRLGERRGCRFWRRQRWGWDC